MKKIIILILTFIGINSFITLKTFAQVDTSSLDLISEAAIVLEANSGKVIYEKNANQKLYRPKLLLQSMRLKKEI